MQSILDIFRIKRMRVLIVTVFLMAGLITIALSTPSDDLKLRFGQIYGLNDGWTAVGAQGDEVMTDLPIFMEAEKGEVIHISRRLPEAFDLERTLRIRSSMQEIQVVLDGVTIFDNSVFVQNKVPYTPATSAWILIDIPQGHDKSLLDLYIASDIEPMTGRINEIYYGSRSDLIADLVVDNLIGIFVILFVFSVAIYAFVASLFADLRNIIRLSYLSMFAFTIGIWMIAEMDIMQLIVGHNYILGSISYIMLPIATIMFVLFIYEAVLRQYKGWIKAIVLSISAYLVISLVLQLLFDVDYIEIIPVFVVLLTLTISLMIGLLVRESRNKSRNASKYLIFMAIVFVTEVLEAIIFFVGDFNNVSTFSSIGIMIFLLLVVGDTVIYLGRVFEEVAESKYLRVIAYKDPLTQGLNRAAFERDIDRLLQADVKRPFRLSMFDLNGLKKINDLYGHEEGDQALKFFYKELRSVFHQGATCYRIGGDEFMVIHYNTSPVAFEQLVSKFELALENYGKTKNYALEAAYGSDIYKFKESFGAFKHYVDMKMYNKKNEQKQRQTVE